MRIFSIILILLTVGCSSIQTKSRPNAYYNNLSVNSFSGALKIKPLAFDIRKKGLSNKDFVSIISHKIKLPKVIRIAVIKLHNDYYWRSFSSELSILSKSMVTGFFDVLKSSKRVYDASFLPSLIVPNSYSLTGLRVAAANYQADLLLTYKAQCHSFTKRKIFKADKSKSYCTVEAILMDVRTGITPFSMTATNTFLAIENKQDINFEETTKKAQLESISKSLGEIAEGVLGYLNKV